MNENHSYGCYNDQVAMGLHDLNNVKEENESLQQKYLSESYEKSKLVSENNKLLDVINNQDVKIADLEEKLKTSLDYNKSLLNALKNCCSTRLNGGLIERAESFLKGVK